MKVSAFSECFLLFVLFSVFCFLLHFQAKRLVKRRLRQKRRSKSRNKKAKVTRNNVLKRSLEHMRDNCTCCTKDCVRSYLRKLFPFWGILKGYSALYDLPCDLMAGFTIGIMHIPQGELFYREFFEILLYVLHVD